MPVGSVRTIQIVLGEVPTGASVAALVPLVPPATPATESIRQQCRMDTEVSQAIKGARFRSRRAAEESKLMERPIQVAPTVTEM